MPLSGGLPAVEDYKLGTLETVLDFLQNIIQVPIDKITLIKYKSGGVIGGILLEPYQLILVQPTKIIPKKYKKFISITTNKYDLINIDKAIMYLMEYPYDVDVDFL